MKHVIGFSGGAASAVTAKIVAQQYPTETILLFHDTRTEPADNSRFRQDVANYIGIPITEDSDGRDIWQLFTDEGILGNGRNTPCSRILKQERSLKYMLDNQPAIIYLGFTCEEWGRAQRRYAFYARHGIEAKFPLIEQKLSKADCMHRITNCWGLTPPQMYEWAEHANCVPCVKGKLAYWGLIYIYEREAWQRAVDAEKEFGHTIFTEAGSLSFELDRCLRLAKEYLTGKEAEKKQALLFDMPCECAV
jgi:hypothetical protein